jgi:hypothetical protein
LGELLEREVASFSFVDAGCALAAAIGKSVLKQEAGEARPVSRRSPVLP